MGYLLLVGIVLDDNGYRDLSDNLKYIDDALMFNGETLFSTRVSVCYVLKSLGMIKNFDSKLFRFLRFPEGVFEDWNQSDVLSNKCETIIYAGIYSLCGLLAMSDWNKTSCSVDSDYCIVPVIYKDRVVSISEKLLNYENILFIQNYSELTKIYVDSANKKYTILKDDIVLCENGSIDIGIDSKYLYGYPIKGRVLANIFSRDLFYLQDNSLVFRDICFYNISDSGYYIIPYGIRVLTLYFYINNCEVVIPASVENIKIGMFDTGNVTLYLSSKVSNEFLIDILDTLREFVSGLIYVGSTNRDNLVNTLLKSGIAINFY